MFHPKHPQQSRSMPVPTSYLGISYLAKIPIKRQTPWVQNVGNNPSGPTDLIFGKTDEFHYLPVNLCQFWMLISIA
jgi:hypothetical protein